MSTSRKPSRFPRPLIASLFHWKNIATVAAAITIAVSFYRYMDLLHSGAVVAYLLYPASIGCLALLLYTRVYVRLPEVRLFGTFFAWVLVVIALNMNRADIIQSPYYYLQQNDILYVTPNKTKAKTADISASTTIWFSVVSTLVSLASLIITIAK